MTSQLASATEGPPQGVGCISEFHMTVTCQSPSSCVDQCLPHRLCPPGMWGHNHTCATGWWLPTGLICHILPCITHTYVSGPNFKEENLSFQCFNSIIYLHLETKLILISQGIILHTDIVTAF